MALNTALRIADGFPRQRMVVLPRPVVNVSLGKPITADLLPTDVGLFPSASRHFIERRRGIPQAIVIYCVRGEGWADVAGNHHVIRQDDVLIVPPGSPHAYGAAEHRPWTIYWSHLAGRNVPHFLSLLDITAAAPVLRATDSRQLVPLFEQVIETLERGYTQTSLTVASLSIGHLFGIVRAGGPGAGSRVADLDERVDQTIGFMQQSVAGTVHVSELAAMAKLSPSHYAVVFKRKVGYSALDYFIRLKMQEACRLLDTTNLPVKEVASRLGYDDPLYFSRAFRRVMDVPPREYREHRKG